MDYAKTMKCVENSFSDFGNVKNQEKPQVNAFIDEDIALWKKIGTGKYPEVVINKVAFRG